MLSVLLHPGVRAMRHTLEDVALYHPLTNNMVVGNKRGSSVQNLPTSFFPNQKKGSRRAFHSP